MHPLEQNVGANTEGGGGGAVGHTSPCSPPPLSILARSKHVFLCIHTLVSRERGGGVGSDKAIEVHG